MARSVSRRRSRSPVARRVRRCGGSQAGREASRRSQDATGVERRRSLSRRGEARDGGERRRSRSTGRGSSFAAKQRSPVRETSVRSGGGGGAVGTLVEELLAIAPKGAPRDDVEKVADTFAVAGVHSMYQLPHLQADVLKVCFTDKVTAELAWTSVGSRWQQLFVHKWHHKLSPRARWYRRRKSSTSRSRH